MNEEKKSPSYMTGDVLFGRFQLTKQIRLDVHGEVWQAVDTNLDEPISLRILPDAGLRHNPKLVEQVRESVRRILLLSHPGIVRTYGFHDDGATRAIASEYVEGDSLDARLSHQSQSFNTSDIAPWMKQVCDALAYAHEEMQMVHGAVCPANIVVDASGNARLLAFDLARALSDPASGGVLEMSASPAYMSPRQLHEGNPRPSDDIYSLGATIYELLTGKPPFHSGNILMQVDAKTPDRVSRRRAELGLRDATIPAEWDETVAACLAKEEAQRPGSAAEVWKRLSVPVITTSPLPELKTARNKSRRLVGLFAGLGVVAVVSGALYWQAVTSKKAQGAPVPTVDTGTVPSNPVTAKVAEKKVTADDRTQSAPVAVTAQGAVVASQLRGGIVIRTVPEGATVEIGALDRDKSPLKVREVLAGKYPVKAHLDGYDDWTGEAEIVGNVFSEMNVTLERSKGVLNITTNGHKVPWSFEKWPTGETPKTTQGDAPMLVEGLPTGEYTIVFNDADGVLTRSVITVDKAGVTLEHAVSGGSLDVVSNIIASHWELVSMPSDISVDKKSGDVPAKIPFLPAGPYVLRFHKDGWPDQRCYVKVAEGTNTVGAQFPCGSIDVTSVPQGAEVIDEKGQVLGKCPTIISELIEGQHTLRLRKDGVESEPLSVNLEAGQALKFSGVIKTYDVMMRAREMDTFEANDDIAGSAKVAEQILLMNNVPSFVRAESRIYIAMNKRIRGGYAASIKDYLNIINDASTPKLYVAKAYWQIGISKDSAGASGASSQDYKKAIQLTSELLEQANVDLDTKVEALNVRASAKGKIDDRQGELADLNEMLGLNGIPAYARVDGTFSRAWAKVALKDYSGAVADFSSVITDKDAKPTMVGLSLYDRAVYRIKLEDYAGAVQDCDAAYNMHSISNHNRAHSMLVQKDAYFKTGEYGKAISSMNKIIALGNVTPEDIAQAYNTRGVCYQRLHEKKLAKNDYKKAMSIVGADPDTIQLAKLNLKAL